MSFDRLSSLEQQPTTSTSTGYSDDPAFTQLTNQLSSRLFTLTSNIQNLNRQLALVGTKKDSETLRDRINQLLTQTRTGFTQVSSGVKKIQTWPDVSPSQKYAQDKLTTQLSSSLADFQAAQRLAAEKTRQYVVAARRVQELQAEGADAEAYGDEPGTVQVPLVQQEAVLLADQGEVEFQESVILQREEEIRGIEQGIRELNTIFQDLGQLVVEQEDDLQHIDANVSRAAQDHKAADSELRIAARHQKGARNRACCLLLILAVILTVILLAVSNAPDGM